MLKGGGACLVARRQGQGRQWCRRSPELRRYRELRRSLTREKRGRKQYKYIANMSNTKQAMLTCSAGLPKDMSKSFSYFRNLFGFIL
jgi:hypothetical protein